MFTIESRAAINDFILKSEKYRTYIPQSMLYKADEAIGSADDTGGVMKYYTLNLTGNVMIASTAAQDDELSPEVKDMFQKVSVYLAAWNAALEKKNKSLYDYEAIMKIINSSGFFVHIHEEDREFESKAMSLTLDTAIITSVISGFASMGGTSALKIAQTVIGSMGKQLTLAASNNQEKKKIAHLLFVCENLMGIPMLNILLFNTTAEQSETVTSSNCHKSISKKVTMKYHMDTFMFVDPDYISKFPTAFESNPDFDALVDRLAGYLD